MQFRVLLVGQFLIEFYFEIIFFDLRFFIFLCCLKDIRVFQKFVDYFFCKSFYWKPCFNGFVVTA